MRKFTLDSFGVNFGILTLRFLQSGREEFEIPCGGRGEAINIRMRFHQYWKLLRAIPESEVPPDLRPFLPDLVNLTSLEKKGDPLTVIICSKDRRKMDMTLIAAMDKFNLPVAEDKTLKLAQEMKNRQSAEDVLESVYGLKEAPIAQPAKDGPAEKASTSSEKIDTTGL